MKIEEKSQNQLNVFILKIYSLTLDIPRSYDQTCIISTLFKLELKFKITLTQIKTKLTLFR